MMSLRTNFSTKWKKFIPEIKFGVLLYSLIKGLWINTDKKHALISCIEQEAYKKIASYPFVVENHVQLWDPKIIDPL